VCNRPGVISDYHSLQGAIDSVPAGSTLLVFPSPDSYGIINVSKKISIYGTGFMLEQNEEPFTAPNAEGVILDAINFSKGSDHSFIQGLQFTDVSASGGYPRYKLDSVSNITISRCQCYMQGFGPTLVYTRNTFNCTFNGCNFVLRKPDAGFDASGGGLYTEIGTGSENLYFTNSIIDNRGGNAEPLSMNYNVSSLYLGHVYFDHNVFIIATGSSNFCNYFYSNNIFYDTFPQQPASPQVNNMKGTAFNNVTTSPTLFAANSGNYTGANGDQVFNYSTFGYHSFDQKWSVQDTSFAKHYARDGGEVGAFGGSTAYVLSGIPNLPEIYSVLAYEDTLMRGHILVRIKGKATN
jgi:hypothetical protein